MSKSDILARIRNSLIDVTQDDPVLDVPVDWQYGQATAVAEPIELFIERVIDYKATVVRAASEKDVPRLVAEGLAQAQATSLVVPAGVDPAWVAQAAQAGVELVQDDPPLSHQRLNEISAVITASVVGMAETGTIALDHRGDQGRRELSLVPDMHVCVIRTDQIVTDVPQAMARLAPSLRQHQPVTWISGPSATSDIELSRVEGVHGPRTLHVIVVG
ncbi:MAG: LUD domain-containing protein [Propionibacteriaceae bacterium]|nr:LUD domain-containing protein [Propionibacteriaceae bacterium]